MSVYGLYWKFLVIPPRPSEIVKTALHKMATPWSFIGSRSNEFGYSSVGAEIG